MLKLSLYKFSESDEKYVLNNLKLFNSEESIDNYANDNNLGKMIDLPSSTKEVKYVGFLNSNIIGKIEKDDNELFVNSDIKDIKYLVGSPIIFNSGDGIIQMCNCKDLSKLYNIDKNLEENNLLYSGNFSSAIRINIIQLCYRITEKYKSIDTDEKDKKFKFIIKIRKDFDLTLDQSQNIKLFKEQLDKLSIHIFDETTDCCSLFDILFNSEEVAKQCLNEIKETILKMYIELRRI